MSKKFVIGFALIMGGYLVIKVLPENAFSIGLLYGSGIAFFLIGFFESK